MFFRNGRIGVIKMFNYKHYIPILRWKAAEKEALGKLGKEEKELITPLIELIMPQPEYMVKDGEDTRIKSPEELLNESIEMFKSKVKEIPNEIAKFWGIAPAFVDLSLIDFSLRIDGVGRIMELGEELKLCLVPVVGLSSIPELKKISNVCNKKYKHGLCLRLFRNDFEKASFQDNIKDFLTEYELSEDDVDIVIDFQITDSKCLEMGNYVGKLPDISRWRTLTVVSGTFPKDLSQLSPDMHFIDRSDFIYWVNQVNSDGLSRKPAFGDYTIQHPIFIEPAPGANPSASIRYTTNDKWLIMRGLALRGEIKGIKSPGHAQYPLLARLLTEQKEFFGADFSYGDGYISEMANIDTKKTGNPRTWLRAGINHHLACTISQVSSLS